MDTILVHGHVHMWSEKTGMSKSKPAFIESVVGRNEIKLVLYFKDGKVKFLPLNNNIINVVQRTYEQHSSYLHLTFQNNDFVFIEKLPLTDAMQLKLFLDRVHQNETKASLRGIQEETGTSSAKIQEYNKVLLCEVDEKKSSKHFKLLKERNTSMPPDLPFSVSKPTLTSRKQPGKRKRIQLSDSDLSDDNFSEETNKESETDLSTSSNGEKFLQFKVLEEECMPPSKFSFVLESPESSSSQVIDLHTLIARLFSPYFMEPNCSEHEIVWSEYLKSLLLFPEKEWQGLPNVGNTCYINVVLQSLCSVPSFTNDLFNQGFPWIKLPRDDFNMRLMQLLVLKDIYNTKTRERLLKNIKKDLPEFGEAFVANSQNDAHEFLSICLVQLKETIQKLNTMWNTEDEYGRKNIFQQIFINSNSNSVLACPVTSNFEFELLSSIFCKSCGAAVFKKEPSRYLSINIPQGMKTETLSIQSCFDLFFETEELEHTCENCNHNKSVVVHKFSKLPRVVIIHLKRYNFDKSGIMKKDEQDIIISKYLKLSCHCNKNTMPPHPFSNNAHIKDLELLKPLHKLCSEIIRLSFSSLLEPKQDDSPTIQFQLNNLSSEHQNSPGSCKEVDEKQQQKDLEEDLKLNVIESEFLLDRTGETFESPEKSEEASTLEKLDSTNVTEATEDNKAKISEKCQVSKQAPEKAPEEAPEKAPEQAPEEAPEQAPEQAPEEAPEQALPQAPEQALPQAPEKAPEQAPEQVPEKAPEQAPEKAPEQAPEQAPKQASEQVQDSNETNHHIEAPEETPLPSLPKSDAQDENKTREKPKSLCDDLGFQFFPHCSQNPRNQDTTDKGKKSKRKMGPKHNAHKEQQHAYRLINVISHLGSSPNSGHYINDAYDFKKQDWFTYSDLVVSGIKENKMHKDRLSTGYIFFYMHNELFKELSAKEKESEAGITFQKD